MTAVTLVTVLAWLLTATTTGDQLLRAWSRGRRRAVDRLQLVRSTVDAVVLLALVRAVAPPPGALSWLWVAAVGLAGVGVAGAVLRWSALAWSAPRAGDRAPQHSRRRAVLGAAYGLGGLALLVVLS